jgi:hypothetical protein
LGRHDNVAAAVTKLTSYIIANMAEVNGAFLTARKVSLLVIREE